MNNSSSKLLLRLSFRSCRKYVTAVVQRPNSRKYSRAWKIDSYGSLENLHFVEHQKPPVISEPDQALIRVLASSVNPIDVAMIKGYGANFLNLARKAECGTEFPMVLGRDFVGEVALKGMEVKEFEVGQKVWGVIPVHKEGSHQDFVAVKKHYVSLKPSNVSDIESSGILYAGLTAWSGLFVSASLGGPLGATTPCGGGRHKRVLVLGAAGGVGSLAVQMLLAEGAAVSATCSKDAVPLVEGLGVANVIDYTSEDASDRIAQSGPYDVVLDCAGKTAEYASKIPCEFKQFVTFNSPLLKNVDDLGLVAGNLKNLTDLVKSNLTAVNSRKGVVKWGYFLPAPQGIEYLRRLVENRQIVPVVQATFPFQEADRAYKMVDEGHLRGKVVIDYN